MLAAIINVPSSDPEWSEWSWHHRLSHSAILSAARQQRGAILVDYVLDPIDRERIEDWLERNQQMHVDATGLVGSQSVDLTDVDFQDPRQVQSWLYLHWQEHQTIERRLGIGS